MLSDFFQEQHTITLVGCAIQYFFFAALGLTETCLMTAMAYDRYAAICNPLLYSSIMSPTLCVGMVLGSYMAGISGSVSQVCAILQLQFCGPNVIRHFFCDMPQLLVLSCSDIFFAKLLLAILVMIFGIINALVVMISYVYIVISIMKITTAKGRSKAFNTCAAHLTVVSLFYTSSSFVYLSSSSGGPSNFDRFASVFYTVYFFFAALGLTEACLMTAMAYDRYAAICNPLLYSSIMSPTLCVGMVLGSYMAGISGSVSQVCAILQLHFCGPNVIRHFFCDMPQLLVLSCSDIFFAKLLLAILAMIFGIVNALVVMISYVYIIISIMKITTTKGRSKTFNTCASHLTVVSLFYTSSSFVYLSFSSGGSSNFDRFASVFYTVMIPMLNPLIYSLRNKEIKDALKRLQKKDGYC
ncbi:Olfactory Receptor 5An1 [Manis pentadactyla]|nr:Olfactory Receptor 5An1 [Manis pentadactyla]